MAQVKVTYDDKRLRRNLRNFDKNVKRSIEAVFDREAADAEVYVKTKAPWTDRTGAARSGLLVIANHGASFDEIFFAYSVNYGIWLEVAHDRKYAIIGPAMRVYSELLMAHLDHLLDRMIDYDA